MAVKARRTRPDGWMGKRASAWLKDQAATRYQIIEVGSWLGRSTKVLAAATPWRVWAVDTWEGTPSDPDQHKLYVDLLATRNPYAEFCKNLAGPIAAGKVVPIRGRSTEVAELLAERKHIGLYTVPDAFDFVFIDADHSYEGCRADIAAYRPLLAPGGLLAGHDYHWPGVKQAVDEAFGNAVTLGPKSLWSLTV